MRPRLALRTLGAVLSLSFAAGALSACGSSSSMEEEFSNKSVVEAAKKAGTANGLCPVMKKPVVPDLFSEYKGEKIGFCCPPCKPKFEKDPEKYMEKVRANPDLYGYHH